MRACPYSIPSPRLCSSRRNGGFTPGTEFRRRTRRLLAPLADTSGPTRGEPLTNDPVAATAGKRGNGLQIDATDEACRSLISASLSLVFVLQPAERRNRQLKFAMEMLDEGTAHRRRSKLGYCAPGLKLTLDNFFVTDKDAIAPDLRCRCGNAKSGSTANGRGYRRAHARWCTSTWRQIRIIEAWFSILLAPGFVMLKHPQSGRSSFSRSSLETGWNQARTA